MPFTILEMRQIKGRQLPHFFSLDSFIRAISVICLICISACTKPIDKPTNLGCRQTKFIKGKLNGINIKTPNWKPLYGLVSVSAVSRSDVRDIPIEYKWDHPTPLSQCQVSSDYIPLRSLSLKIIKRNTLRDKVIYNRMQLISNSNVKNMISGHDIITKDFLVLTKDVSSVNYGTNSSLTNVGAYQNNRKNNLLCYNLNLQINSFPREYCRIQYRFDTNVMGVISFSVYVTASEKEVKNAAKVMVQFLESIKQKKG